MKRLYKQKRYVSDKRGTSYAPRDLRQGTGSQGPRLKKEDLAKAPQQLADHYRLVQRRETSSRGLANAPRHDTQLTKRTQNLVSGTAFQFRREISVWYSETSTSFE